MWYLEKYIFQHCLSQIEAIPIKDNTFLLMHRAMDSLILWYGMYEENKKKKLDYLCSHIISTDLKHIRCLTHSVLQCHLSGFDLFGQI